MRKLVARRRWIDCRLLIPRTDPPLALTVLLRSFEVASVETVSAGRLSSISMVRKQPPVAVAMRLWMAMWIPTAKLLDRLPFTPDTRVMVASVSKTVTAVAVLRLLDELNLDLATRI